MPKEIEVKGLDFLNEDEKKTTDKLFSEGFKKLKRKLNSLEKLKIHIKIYSEEGNARKFSLNFVAVFGDSSFEASFADWDFAKTVHKAFSKLENQIEHKFHVSDQDKNFARFRG